MGWAGIPGENSKTCTHGITIPAKDCRKIAKVPPQGKVTLLGLALINPWNPVWIQRGSGLSIRMLYGLGKTVSAGLAAAAQNRAGYLAWPQFRLAVGAIRFYALPAQQ
jgi:hypothetical protein